MFTRYFKRVLGVFLVLGVLFFLNKADVKDLLTQFLQNLQGQGLWGMGIFILLYIAACVFFLPGAMMTLGAGFIYGLFQGTLLVSIASIIGATLSFLLGRYLVRDWITRKMSSSDQFKRIDEAIAQQGSLMVVLMRLSPLFPFNLLNYAFGLTQISVHSYFFASWIGMLPGTIMYVYIGSIASSLLNLENSSHERSVWEWGFYGIGFVATLVVTFYIAYLAKKALHQEGKDSA